MRRTLAPLFRTSEFLACVMALSCGGPLDPLVPGLIASDPAPGGRLSSGTNALLLRFNGPMDLLSTEAALHLRRVGDGGTESHGTMNWEDEGRSLRFHPKAPLRAGSAYVIDLDTTARNAAGFRLARRQMIRFTVGDPDASPRAILLEPAGPIRTRRPLLRLRFDRSMDKASVEAAFTRLPSVAGRFTWDSDRDLSFLPEEDLPWPCDWIVRLDESARSTEGIPLVSEASWSLRIGECGPGPRLLGVSASELATSPPDLALDGDRHGVSRFTRLVFRFDRAVDSNTLAGGVSFSPFVEGEFRPRSGAVGEVEFLPRLPFESEAPLRISVDRTIRDLHGLPLEEPCFFRFWTDGADGRSIRVTGMSYPNGLVAESGSVPDLESAEGGIDVRLAFDPAFGARIDPASALRTVTVQRMAGEGGSGSEGTISSWLWDGEGRALSVRLGALRAGNWYRLRVAGGISGLQDTRTNRMSSDFIRVFHVARER